MGATSFSVSLEQAEDADGVPVLVAERRPLAWR